MKLLKSLLAPVFASVILSACTLDAERPTDVQHIDKKRYYVATTPQKKSNKFNLIAPKDKLVTSVHKSVFRVALSGNIKTRKPISLKTLFSD